MARPGLSSRRLVQGAGGSRLDANSVLATHFGRGPEDTGRAGAAAAGAGGRMALSGATVAEPEVIMDLITALAISSIVLQVVALLRKQR